MRAVFVSSLAIVVALPLACRRDTAPDGQPPMPTSPALSAEVSAAVANGDLLVRGSMDYVVVPLDWKLIDRDGKEQPIPKAPGSGAKFHRLPANRALLATDGTAPDKAESMMFSSLHTKGPVDAAMLDRYAEQIGKGTEAGTKREVAGKTIYRHAETGDLRGKLFVTHAPPDGRVEVHYLITDRARETWSLVYLTRRENGEKWRQLLADLE
jgi:hypothetical protein